MDANISGEELLAKERKPYTITKQLERWTDDEHDRAYRNKDCCTDQKSCTKVLYKEETGITKLNSDSKTDKEEVVAVHDSNNTQNKRPVDRSSCGSNTPSGSDAEIDALEKVEKDNEDVKETNANQSAIELSNRKTKIRDSNNPTTDSWNEVSEGGRLAFQALFARGRLPQSFSPPQDVEKETQNQNDMSMSLVPNNNNQDFEVKGDQGRLVMISNGPGKNLKTRQTGFKPYKRCSMEVKESQVGDTNNQSDEKVCKRIRLEGEAST